MAREEQKSGAQAYLQQRANHAKLQLDTAEDLQKLLQRFASGLQFGPYSSALSSSSVKVSCRSIKPGFVLFEVSEKSDFSEVAQRVEAPALPRDEPSEESSSEEKEMRSVEVQTTHVILTNLKPSTKYYLRCHYTSSSIQVYEQVEIPETSSTNPMDDDMFASADENALMDGLDESAELKISGRKAQEDIFLTSFGRIYSTGEFWTAPSEQVDDDHVDSDAQSLEQRALHDHSTASVDGDLSNVEHASNSALFYPPVSITCFGQIPLHEIANPYSARILQQRPVDRVPELDEIHLLENGCPSVFALLGELLPTSENDELENFPNLESRLANMLAKCGLFNSLQCSSPIFSQSSVLFSFYDSSRSAVQRLKREELLYKQYRQDLKKYKKKYNALLSRTNDSSKGVTSQDVVSTPHFPPAPTLKRPALLESLQAFLEVLAFH